MAAGLVYGDSFGDAISREVPSRKELLVTNGLGDVSEGREIPTGVVVIRVSVEPPGFFQLHAYLVEGHEICARRFSRGGRACRSIDSILAHHFAEGDVPEKLELFVDGIEVCHKQSLGGELIEHRLCFAQQVQGFIVVLQALEYGGFAVASDTFLVVACGGMAAMASSAKTFAKSGADCSPVTRLMARPRSESMNSEVISAACSFR